MRIQGQHVGIHERLEHILRLALIHALLDVFVAFAQHVHDVRPLFARDHERQGVILDALAPQLVHLRGVRRPRFFLTIEVEGFVDVEVRFLREQFDRVIHALAVTLLEAAEDHEGRLHVARLDRVVELVAIFLEFGDVARIKIAAAAVDGVEIAVEDQTGEAVVERGPAVVFARHDVGDPARDVILLLRRGELAGRGDCGRRRHRRSEQRGKPDRTRADEYSRDPARAQA